MLPILLDLKFIKIYTFGVFLVLAFFWSTFMLWKNIRLTSYKEEEVFDGLFFSMIGGLFVGRLVYVALHFEKFGFDILKFILINGYPGLSLYAIFVGAFLTFMIFANLKKIKFTEIIDYAISPLLVAVAIGKLGSFFAGTEIGTKTKFPLALKYANMDGARHLTAFYESILFFIAAYFAYKFLFAIRRDKYSRGMTFFFFGWVFSLVYLLLDPLKNNRVLLFGQSVTWAVSLSLLLTFTLYFLYHLRTQILNGLKRITNYVQSNAKINKKFHNNTTNKVRGGADKTSTTDPETEG